MIYRPLKRGLDICLSAVLLVVFLPLMIVVGLLALVLQGRPILFVQVRPGLHEQPFKLVKFRTMSHGKRALDGALREKYITRFGKILRSLSIDELPQLVNILRGDMSFVGPRPERPQFVEQLAEAIPYYRERHAVKPGITGWAQVNYPYGASDKDTLEKLYYDLYYVRKHSLMLDAIILVKTVYIVIFGRGQ